MVSISSIILYILVFFSAYVQVFFLVTFLENRKKIIVRKGETKLSSYPKVTIVVPAWNEEGTVAKSVRSLLELNYPQDKLQIFLVDDGSSDNTYEVFRQFEQYSNVKIFQKENGGKYTALNLGLAHMETDFFGGMDADSIAHPEALTRIMSYFEKDQSTMAVAPSVTVHSAKNIIQSAQKAEYHMGVYTKKMLGFLGAINVTPGPLTIFRKKVFDDLGVYRHGHNTEDMEIAYRMQKNEYKIEHCNDAYVYTNTPTTVGTLYRQRLRWIYGFINNTIDYRDVLFKKKYGNFSLFTLPTGLVSVLAVSYLFGKIVYDLGDFLYSKVVEFQAVGINLSAKVPNFDTYFLNVRSSVFLVMFIYSLVVFAIIFGRRMAEGRWVLSLDMLYFLVVFRVIAPVWLLHAMYNTLRQRKPSWR
jgi:cellulose synthase/poly-beta-1,6-N-acetylglucosamine synthase-like glycosyltransferase